MLLNRAISFQYILIFAFLSSYEFLLWWIIISHGVSLSEHIIHLILLNHEINILEAALVIFPSLVKFKLLFDFLVDLLQFINNVFLDEQEIHSNLICHWQTFLPRQDWCCIECFLCIKFWISFSFIGFAAH